MKILVNFLFNFYLNNLIDFKNADQFLYYNRMNLCQTYWKNDISNEDNGYNLLLKYM